MLRFDFMPSDFNPLFLFLGESADLAALAGTLRAFASTPAPLDVREALKDSVSNARLFLVPEHGESGNYGLKQVGAGEFRWGLNRWQAEQIAARIDVLVANGERSGSEIIEFGTDGEIPVKVSRGEFEDEFLISKF